MQRDDFSSHISLSFTSCVCPWVKLFNLIAVFPSHEVGTHLVELFSTFHTHMLGFGIFRGNLLPLNVLLFFFCAVSLACVSSYVFPPSSPRERHCAWSFHLLDQPFLPPCSLLRSCLGGRGSLRTHPTEVVIHSFRVLFPFNNVCNFYVLFHADFNRKALFLVHSAHSWKPLLTGCSLPVKVTLCQPEGAVK